MDNSEKKKTWAGETCKISFDRTRDYFFTPLVETSQNPLRLRLVVRRGHVVGGVTDVLFTEETDLDVCRGQSFGYRNRKWCQRFVDDETVEEAQNKFRI